MKFLVCSDSFKESLTSKEVSDVVSRAVQDVFDDACIHTIVMADGGEGSLDAIENVYDAKRVYVDALDALGRKVTSYYLVYEDHIFIEMANSAGLALIEKEKRNVLASSSRGFGMVLASAIDRKESNIHVFLGGSATNDAGLGAMSEIGVLYFDEDGKQIKEPKAADLSRIHSIDRSALNKCVEDKNFYMYADVHNELLGEQGATFVYARQKGASEEDVLYLERSMHSYHEVLKDSVGYDVSSCQSSGSAGGMGSALISYLNAKVCLGSDYFLELNNFDEEVLNADYVITGEGKFDLQSSMGKVVSKVIERSNGKKVVVFCGVTESTVNDADIVSIKPVDYSALQAMREAKTLLYKSAYKYFKEERWSIYT